MPRIPSVLVYARRDAEVLVMHRNKEPNLGLWVAPGGKLEAGESPQDAAKREMAEETGLTVGSLKLRGFCTEVSERLDWEWFLFIFEASSFQGVLQEDLREGSLSWVSVRHYLEDLSIPQADAIFAPRVLDPEAPLFQAKFVYDASLRLVEWVEY